MGAFYLLRQVANKHVPIKIKKIEIAFILCVMRKLGNKNKSIIKIHLMHRADMKSVGHNNFNSFSPIFMSFMLGVMFFKRFTINVYLKKNV